MALLTHLPCSSTALQSLSRPPTIPITNCCCRGNSGHIFGSSEDIAKTWEADPKFDSPTAQSLQYPTVSTRCRTCALATVGHPGPAFSKALASYGVLTLTLLQACSRSMLSTGMFLVFLICPGSAK